MQTRRGAPGEVRGPVGGVGVLRGVRLRVLRRHSGVQPVWECQSPKGRRWQRGAYRNVARWPCMPSSAVRLTRMRVSGSSCGARGGVSGVPYPCKLGSRAWHSCSVAASPPQAHDSALPSASSSAVGTRLPVEQLLACCSCPSASTFAGQACTSRHTVRAAASGAVHNAEPVQTKRSART